VRSGRWRSWRAASAIEPFLLANRAGIRRFLASLLHHYRFAYDDPIQWQF
jgi:hypothetical protein